MLVKGPLGVLYVLRICGYFLIFIGELHHSKSVCLISITVTSWWEQWRLKSPAPWLFTQTFVQMQIKDNIEAPHRWPLCRQFTDQWRIPRTKGQWRGKCFHLMTSSFPPPTLSSHSVVALTLFVHWKMTAILTKYSSLASPEVYKIATPVRGCIENISKMKSEIVHHGRTKFCRVSFETNIRLVYLVVMALKGLGGLFFWWKLPMMVAS